MILAIFLLIVGLVLLIKGADFFVEGASNIAKALGIPTLIIGLTLVSIGTSMPEMSVSVQSSIKNMNDMSFGNIIGSNIFNTFIVIGVCAIFAPITITKNMKKYDLPILFIIYLIVILFGFIISPLKISRIESIIIFILMFIYTIHLIIRSKNEKSEELTKKRKWYINLLFIILGLAGIIFGGDLVVDNASKIAIKLGLSELMVGLTIVAIGTSLPELVTSIMAARKKEYDIAIGNAIGSCIFNIVLILGLSGIISPISLNWLSLIDCLVMVLSVILLFVFCFKNNKMNKLSGIIFIIIYIIYVVFIILRNLNIIIIS